MLIGAFFPESRPVWSGSESWNTYAAAMLIGAYPNSSFVILLIIPAWNTYAAAMLIGAHSKLDKAIHFADGDLEYLCSSNADWSNQVDQFHF